MKQIIYRKEPLKNFWLHGSKKEFSAIVRESKRLQKEHPDWDVLIVERNTKLIDLSFIQKENNGITTED